MLNSFITAIPEVLAAAAIIIVTYVIAKPLSAFVTNISSSAGIDEFPKKLGIKNGGKSKISELFGKIFFFFLMLFASVEAANRLQFDQFSELVAVLIKFGSQVLLGSVIIAVGVWIANIVSAAIAKASGGEIVADLVRLVIIGLVLAPTSDQ